MANRPDLYKKTRLGTVSEDTSENDGRRGPTPPSPWIKRFAPLVSAGGAVLDLACGGGRHARLFLERGHPVTALDVDLSRLGALAGAPGLETIEADLEQGDAWPLGERRFAAVVVTSYLWRPLFPHIVAAVGAGGVLLYETFSQGNERFNRPRNPDFLLEEGELIEVVRGELSVVAYEHGEIAETRRGVVQRLCAVRDGPVPIPPAIHD
jgi:SAM-dependent methyltransferase